MTFSFSKLGRYAIKKESIFKIVTVWPFNFWPDEIILDDEKLTIIRRGFLTREVIPIKLPDLLNIEIKEAPIFCTVVVIAKFVTARHEEIPFVTKKDGRELQERCLRLLIEKHDKDSGGGQ